MWTSEQKELMKAAGEAAAKAYAPYSRFKVGAAVLTNKGIFHGANIENGSSNLGICAERVAISHARMNDGNNIIGVAVNCIDANTEDSRPNNHMPCGACRQWLAELAPDAWIITNGVEQVFSLEDILPIPFNFSHK